MNFNDLKAKTLTRSQMRDIKGGANGNGTCGYKKDGRAYCNLSKAQVMAATDNGNVGNWCCDSCPSSSYCG